MLLRIISMRMPVDESVPSAIGWVPAIDSARRFWTVGDTQAAAKAARDGTTVPDVRALFDKAAQIDDISSVAGKELEITKENDKVVIRFGYEKEIELFGPVFLLIKYAGQSK